MQVLDIAHYNLLYGNSYWIGMFSKSVFRIKKLNTTTEFDYKLIGIFKRNSK